MTRLISEWIYGIEENAAEWNERLKYNIGLDFIDLATLNSKADRAGIIKATKEYRVAVIPITSGLGTITSFAESVAAIVRSMGFNAFVTEKTDVDGIYEAYTRGAEIMFMADDDRYIAINRRTGEVSDNNIATATGYAEVLLAMASKEHLDLKVEVAVLGYGIIGKLIAEHLAKKGVDVHIFDKDVRKRSEVEESGFTWIDSKESLRQYELIADATSEGGWLDQGLLHKDALISAPGVPLSLTDNAMTSYEGRFIHDLLEIGTACMVGGVL